jgi:Glycosyltransferases involved in cell wall biogenesis
MVKLSACVIVKNEEKNLPLWLECMQNIAFEMIVVDTGSTDQTKDLARAAGATVYDFAWQDDFSAAKNFALEKATGNWIAFLDADEYFTAETADNLLPYLEKMDKNKEVDAFFCHLVNIDADDHNRFIDAVQSLRVFRRDEKLRFIGPIHEFLARAGGPLRIMSMEADVEIYHTGYSQTILKAKLERNLHFLQKIMAEHGEKPWYYGYLADCYFGLKDYEKARVFARRSIDSKVKAMGQESAIYRTLIDATALAGRPLDEVSQVIQLAIDKFPQMPEFVWSKGELLFLEKDYAAAEKCLQKALEMQENSQGKQSSGTFSGRINFVYCTLGKIAFLKNDMSQALTYYVESLKLYRYSEIALQSLYCLLRRLDPADGISLLRVLYADTKVDLQFMVRSLKAYATDKIYLYYVQRLKNKYGIDESIDLSAEGFFAVGQYEQAAEHSIAVVKDAYEFMIMEIVEKYDEQRYQTSQILLPKVYRNVLDKFLGRLTKLSAAEQQIYTAMQHSFGKKNGKDNAKAQFIDLIKNLEEPALASSMETEIMSYILRHNLSAKEIYDWIDEAFAEHKVKPLIDLAVLFYKSGKMEEALRLLCHSYGQNRENLDLSYAFAFLLHVYGDDEGARKVIQKAPVQTTEMSDLLEEMDAVKNLQ